MIVHEYLDRVVSLLHATAQYELRMLSKVVTFEALEYQRWSFDNNATADGTTWILKDAEPFKP